MVYFRGITVFTLFLIFLDKFEVIFLCGTNRQKIVCIPGSTEYLNKFMEKMKNIKKSEIPHVLGHREDSSDPLWTEVRYQSERTTLSLHHAKYEPYPLSEIVMDDTMVENLQTILEKFHTVSRNFSECNEHPLKLHLYFR